MTGGLLVDSNLLIYAFDPAGREKQRSASALLDRLAASGRGVLSTQVLGEFFRVTTEKLPNRLTRSEARREVIRFAESWPVAWITPLIVLEAARGVEAFGLSYWDAQLWATARLNQIGVLLSEDFQDGHRLDGVRFLNPFAPSFDLAAILA
jgi:predicted nucleic acid-binding protein